MNLIVLLLAYQGTAYSGWQRQPNALSIQEVIENAITRVVHTRLPVYASGRTDAQVHALGQVAHFTQPPHPAFSHPQNIKKMLNAILPHDIVIRDVVITDASFHSRFQTTSKEYHYTLSRLPKPLPWERNRVYSPHHDINTHLMREGAHYLLGTHDFASFSNHGREYSSTVRTLYTLEIVENDHLVTILCRGSGFLYKMVRNIVGSLLDISKKKYPPQHIQEILARKDRRQGPPSAPGHALCLHHVCYPEPYCWFCTPQCVMRSKKEG